MFFLKRFFLVLALFLLTASPVLAQDKIIVGTTAGSDVEILEKAKEVAAKNNLEVVIIEFTDYVMPNLALDSGEIDLNAFQHKPYLDSFVKTKNLKLVDIGNTYITPMGFYSNKIKSIEEIKEGDSLTIPNDPTNGGRALLILSKMGLIELDDPNNLVATPLDIKANPKKLKFIEVDAAQGPRALDDVTLAAINTNFAEPAGLNPSKDSIFLEDKNSPYVNVIVAREKDKDNPLYKKFVEAYQSPEVAKFILEKYKGSTIPAFDY